MDDLDGLFSSGTPASPTLMSPGPQQQGFPPPANTIPSPVTQMGGVNFPGGLQSPQMPGMVSPVQGMPGHQVSIMPGQQPQVPMMPGQQPQVPMMPGQQQVPGAMMMTPTQTQAATQLNNKTQILNQFQSPQAPVGMMPPRPAPGIPGQQQQQQQMPQQFVQQQPPQQQDAGFGDGFMASLSVTEPMPQEFDDMFTGQQSGGDAMDGGQTKDSNPFFDAESSKQPPQAEGPPSEEIKEVKQDEAQDNQEVENQGNEAESQPERKTSFWSGLWNRNKDHGSKENMLEEAGTEKKEQDDGKIIFSLSLE